MGAPSRLGLGAGLLCIIALAVALGVWAYRPDYQVLFADLAARDAAAMTAELDKLKTPYRLAEGGNTILVPQDLVYKTRLKLMGTDVPLHGAVGFEVFNNADFGMTEFVQKVNYQRAVQGELTRTILSIEDIQAARVHLALPEQGLFKKALAKPKASVTLTMKPGRVLAPDQVTGIQRLVAASVPDIASGDVTLLDQHGVALTRVNGADQPAEGASHQLDAKRSTEDYLVKKVTQVLDRSFGAGQSIATVDVLLNLDQSRITTEEILPARGAASGGAPTGVVVRERHTVRDGDSPAPGAAAKAGNGSSSAESDYQVGRRTEQLAVASGAVRRMTVAVVVKQRLAPDQLEKLREVVALAVGFNSARGDAIVVNSLDQLASAGAVPLEAPVASAALADPAPAHAAAVAAPDPQSALLVTRVLAGLLAAAVCAGVALVFVRRRQRASRPALDDAGRALMLAQVRAWIDAGPGVAGERK